LIEALACGCSVVATDCPSGPREILEGVPQGRLVPVGDPAALAGALGNAIGCEQSFPIPEGLGRYDYRRVAASYLAMCEG
jgi:glycosyltransferase involved in cell wall biosynthesis